MRIGFIGSGLMAGSHLKNLQGIEECEIAAISDVDRSAIWRLKRSLPWVKEATEFTDYHQMIESAKLDAVIIVTPHSLHHEQSIFALRNNLDVLIEKPMVMKIDEAREIAELSKIRKKLVMVAYQRHTEPKYVYARQSIARGELGKIHYITGIQTQGWLQDKLGTWRTDPKFNELGYVADSGSHLIDAIRWIDGSRAEEVYAQTDYLSSPVPVNASIIIRFSSGATAGISLTGGAPEWREQLRFFGELGEIICNYDYDEYYQSVKTSVEIIDRENSKALWPLRMLPLRSNPSRNFVNSLLGREEPACPVDDGVKTVEILDAIQTSAKSGKAVKL